MASFLIIIGSISSKPMTNSSQKSKLPFLIIERLETDSQIKANSHHSKEINLFKILQMKSHNLFEKIGVSESVLEYDLQFYTYTSNSKK